MWNLFISLTMPPVFVFGLYHLLTWFNLRGINECVYWKRVAVASAVAHALLTAGFFVFSYFDYRASREFTAFGASYGDFLFSGSQFWPLITIFDTAAMAVIVGLFAVLDWMGMAPSGLVPVTMVLTFAVGTAQWYFVGGGIGALLQKFWTGLKGNEGADPLIP